MNSEKQNIGIVAFPICEAGEATDDTRASNLPFSNLVDILKRLFNHIYVLTGNEERVLFKKDDRMHVAVVSHPVRKGLIFRIINYIYTQLRLSFQLGKLSGSVNSWIFFIGAEALILPVLTAKLLRKRVIIALSGFPSGLTREEKEPFFKTVGMLMRINLALSDRIIAYSDRIVVEHDLGKYRDKIVNAREHFLDLNKLKCQIPLNQREDCVAYIGRLSEGKGITNLMEAIYILVKQKGISFLIGGDGPLRGWLEEQMNRDEIKSRVKYTGWISRDELPGYLNQVKLLVLPSYTEALPNIILEAMACGTPVLTTAVGAIPDIINDGETGFIMENNSPDCIADNITRVLGHPELAGIAEKARVLVEEEFTIETAVLRYQKMMDTPAV